MIKFRTEYNPSKSELGLSPDKPVVLVGSCFSENICKKMNLHQWHAINPLGTLYNPFSIALALNAMIDKPNGKEIFEKSLFQSDGIWHSHLFDSSFSSKIKEDCVSEFSERQEEFLSIIEDGKILLATFGTSICYYRTGTTLPVGNCHKQPACNYYRKRLSVDEIFSVWSNIILELNSKFPGIKIIFTVSPVRHIKDGFEGNSRSKAVLLLATELICKNFNNCEYFPAFEIINDDLRDYRFYASDLVHPSDDAVEYIWEIFKKRYIDEPGQKLLAEGEKRMKAINHRPMTGALGKQLS